VRITLALLNGFIAGARTKPFTNIGRKGAYAPSTLTTLASLVPLELDSDVSIIDEFVTPFNPHTLSADLVGLSFTTPNANHAYRIAGILRGRGITVVMGGYHVSALPEEAIKHADSCVIGYAEKSWPKLLRDFNKGKLKPIYEEAYEENYKELRVTKHSLLKRDKYFYPNTLEFSRSCNNSCRFCVIPNFCKTGLSFRSTLSIMHDVERMKGKEVVLLDSSPTENLNQFESLCHLFKKLNVNWYTAITFKMFNHPQLLELMAASGCRGVLIGFESLNQKSLNHEKKNFNVVHNYKECVRLLHSLNMYVFGSFVFGFDEDDKSVFDEIIDFVDECAIDLAHYAILTPFPGSKLFHDLKEQSRILTYDWSKYDSLHVTFRPNKMSAEELQTEFKKAYTKTHSLKSILRRTINSPCRTRTTFFGNLGLGYYGRAVLSK